MTGFSKKLSNWTCGKLFINFPTRIERTIFEFTLLAACLGVILEMSLGEKEKPQSITMTSSALVGKVITLSILGAFVPRVNVEGGLAVTNVCGPLQRETQADRIIVHIATYIKSAEEGDDKESIARQITAGRKWSLEIFHLHILHPSVQLVLIPKYAPVIEPPVLEVCIWLRCLFAGGQGSKDVAMLGINYAEMGLVEAQIHFSDITNNPGDMKLPAGQKQMTMGS